MWEFLSGLSSRYGLLVPKPLDHLTTFTLPLALASRISVDLSYFSGPVAYGSHFEVPINGSLHKLQAFQDLSPSTTLAYSRRAHRDIYLLQDQHMTGSLKTAISSIQQCLTD
jgi:hypothetical protein